MCSSPENSQSNPLNPRQIARIEAVHQGFLYQHLYAVQILLSEQDLKWEFVRIERDEDIEVGLTGRKAYVQVKKRASSLSLTDVEGSIGQFTAIQAEHEAGRRDGTPQLWFVSNAPPSNALFSRIADDAWQKSIFVLTPTFTNGGENELPVPAASIEDQFLRCVSLANRIEHATLSPETLVWKLAAWVQAIAAGALPKHEITSSALQPLFEQLVIQLQQFPNSPARYRAQEDEPTFDSSQPIRLITGHSGAGKTSWAGEFGLHRAANAIYFDCSDLPSSAIAASLVRELAARYLPNPEERKAILLPGAQGLQGLRLIDDFLSRQAVSPCLVLDNVQRIAAHDANEIMESLRAFHFVLLAQPSPDLGLIEGRLGVTRQMFEGWSIATIAEEAQEAGCFADPATCEEVRTLTGGSPLFVRDLSKLAQQAFDGDLEAANEHIKAGLHERTTYQEFVVAQVLQRLGEAVANAAALLALSSIPLQRSVALEMIAAALECTTARVAGYFREAAAWSIVQNLSESRVELHEAFRASLFAALRDLPEPIVTRAREKLLGALLRDLNGGGIDQYMLLARLFLDTGRIDNLVDMATSSAELVREHGAEDAMRSLVEQAAGSPNLEADNRFWALDSLAFWAIANDELELAQKHINVMTSLSRENQLTPRAKSAYAIKLLALAGKRENLKSLSKTMQRCKKMGLDAEAWRVARYTYAAGLYLCDEYERAVTITLALGIEYYDELGIDPMDAIGANPPELAAKIGDLVSKGDDLKHLADCLDLQAKALLELGRDSRFCRIHAHKFYLLAEALSSSMKVGQDFVDECLRVRSDPEGARMFLENTLLPIIKERQLLSYLVPVSCQYAVVLAYCDEDFAARRTLAEMRPFIVPGSHQEAEYLQQCTLVERILSAEFTLQTLNDLLDP